MPAGPLEGVGMENSLMAPDVVIRPIFPIPSVNQRLPSGPAVIRSGEALAVGRGNSVIVVPGGVMRPMFSAKDSVNHKFPSGPVVMPCGSLLGVGDGDTVDGPPVV